MNCQRFETVVADIARGRILDSELRADALAHSRTCANCAGRLEDEIGLTLRLKNFAASFESVGAPAWIEASLIKSFRTEPAVVGNSHVGSSRAFWFGYGAAAIAALLLIVFALVVLRAPQPPMAKAEVSDGFAIKPAALFAAFTQPAVPPKRILLVHRKSPKATPASGQYKPSNTNEIATDFIPVNYGGVANLADGGRMIRVELPHSAMASFGLPVNMDRANEKVKADVLLGVDGLAHAIRFVR